MTRSRSDVEAVLKLSELGLSKRAISLRTGVSRASVREWLNDPERALRRSSSASTAGRRCDGVCRTQVGIDPAAYSYLLGMYLGDGTISEHRRGVFRLRIACCDAYPRIMDEVSNAIERVVHVSPDRVKCVGCTEVGAYWKHWPCVFPQHGPGLKHERSIELADWQRQIVEERPRLFIRGLIQSDGWRGNNVAIKHTTLAIEYRTYSRYIFTNRSNDIRALFCWALNLLGIHWTQSNEWTIAVSRRKDVHMLDSFVGPKR